MRKTLLTLVTLFTFGLLSNYAAPFNLKTFEGDVPAGCSIDTIEGIPYLKVPIDGWNTFFSIEPLTVSATTTYKFSYKYDKGTVTDPTPVQAFIQFISSDWSNKFAITNSPASETVKNLSGNFKAGTYTQLQLAVQKTAGDWGAISGPYLYIGKLQVVNPFDIRTFEGDVPEGTEIVTIDGKKYLQVVLNGWNSTFNVRPFLLRSGYQATVEFKYKRCQATADTLELAKINAVVQLMDTVNKVKNPWGEGMVPSSTGLSQSPASESFKTVTAALSKDMKLINQIQFFGQQTISWGPTTGDTIWVSPVTITSNNPIVLDPEDVDPSTLPSWMTVVTINNKKYFQVILDGWNSTINIVPVILKPKMTAQVEFKYAPCQATLDTLEATKINAVVQVMDTVNKMDNPWGEGLIPSATGLSQSPASATFKVASGKLHNLMQIINQVQFFGQQTISWGPTVGDTLWLGKIVLVDLEKPTAPANLTATVNGKDVTLTWEASTDNDAVKGYIITQNGVALDTVNKLTYTVKDLADGSYTFGVSALDKSGNQSTEVKAEGVVVGTSVKETTISGIEIYPNPVSGSMNIRSNELIKSVTIFNITGQVEKIMSINANNALIDMQDISSGIYFIKVNTNNGVVTQRIIKK